jgi:lipopolysaccharide biosynthesis glycosyltransferase
MDILITSSEKYYKYTKVALYSFFVNNKGSHNIHFINDLQYFIINDFKTFCSNHHSIGYSYNLSKLDLPIEATNMQHWNYTTLFRLLAFKVLPKTVDKVILIESDVIIKSNLNDLYNLNIDSYAFALSHENRSVYPNATLAKPIIDELKLTNDSYYNYGGVFLINLKYLRSNFSIEIIRNFYNKYKIYLRYLDQDLINIIFNNKIRALDPTIYNFDPNIYIKTSPFNDKSFVNSKVIHYRGRKKPFNFSYKGKYFLLYWKYAAKHLPLQFLLNFIFRLPYLIFMKLFIK